MLHFEKLRDIWFTGDYFSYFCILMPASSNEMFAALKALSPVNNPNPCTFGSNSNARLAFQTVGFREKLLPLGCLVPFFSPFLFSL